jgi:hypothetical protein
MASESFVGWLQDEIAPVPNKAYTDWLLRLYLNNGIRYFEDFGKTKEVLSAFEKNKKRLDIKDINQFKRLPDLLTYMDNNKLKTISKGSVKRSEKEYAEKTTEILYDGKEGKILWPRSKTASCYYGKDTHWCVSASTSTNQFNDYAYKQDMNIVFVFPKDGTKWALVFDEDEITEAFDQADDEIDPEEVFAKYPWIDKVLPTPERRTSTADIQSISPHDFIHLVDIGQITKDDLTTLIPDLPLDKLRVLIEYNPHLILLVPNPPEWLVIDAIKEKWTLIKNMDNPSEAVQLAAISQFGHAITYIRHPSEEMKIAAVKQNSWNIRHIKNPSEEVQLAAVSKVGDAIEYISDPSDDVKLAAVKQNGWNIRHIKNPSEEMQLAAVTNNGMNIQGIKHPSEAAQLAAVRNFGPSIEYIKNPTPRVNALAK